jgi:hypothetical protein
MNVALLASKDKTRTNLPSALRMRFARTDPVLFAPRAWVRKGCNRIEPSM